MSKFLTVEIGSGYPVLRGKKDIDRRRLTVSDYDTVVEQGLLLSGDSQRFVKHQLDVCNGLVVHGYASDLAVIPDMHRPSATTKPEHEAKTGLLSSH